MSENFFLNYLDSIGRKRVILDRNGVDPYLERYYLFLKDRKKFPFNVFLHKFLRSDPDDLHDHPWGYATVILKGGYWEWIPTFDLNKVITGERKVWRGPGHMRKCKANSYHRIELEPVVTCWTLFMPGIQQRNWGFLTHKNWDWKTFKWIPFNEYIDNRRM
jgi:hypothetical protein